MWTAIKRTFNWFFPASCSACASALDGFDAQLVCSSCEARIRFSSTYSHSLDGVDRFHAAAHFDGPLRDLVHRFKYQGKDYLAPFLGGLLARRYPRGEECDCLVPVPIPFWRKRKRGYNQAELLARELGRRWNKPVLDGWLIRKNFHPPQVSLNRAGRQANARKSYGLSHRGSLPYGNILLVDDVCTTGATLKICAQLLRKAGAKTVSAVVLAQEDFSPRR